MVTHQWIALCSYHTHDCKRPPASLHARTNDTHQYRRTTYTSSRLGQDMSVQTPLTTLLHMQILSASDRICIWEGRVSLCWVEEPDQWFLSPTYRYGYTPALVDMEQLLRNADETLFCKALKDVHCLHHLLPEIYIHIYIKTLPIQLRPAITTTTCQYANTNCTNVLLLSAVFLILIISKIVLTVSLLWFSVCLFVYIIMFFFSTLVLIISNFIAACAFVTC